jgi:hypothetical protein
MNWPPAIRIISIVTLVLLASGIALADGSRLVVAMDEPFEAGGQLHPAASLSLRPVHEFTPTTSLNEVWVGNRCLGLVAAVKSDDPRLEASRNSVLFERSPDGILVLRGFAYRLPGSPGRYRYALFVAGADARIETADDTIGWAEAGPVVLAANTDG